MHLGRFRQGDTVPYWVLCTNSSGVPTDPDSVPVAETYSSSANVESLKVPILDRARTTGFFGGEIFLGSGYTEGEYTLTVRWQISSHQGVSLFRFEVLPDGNSSGQVIAMHGFVRPQARFVVNQRTSGQLYKGKNPRK